MIGSIKGNITHRLQSRILVELSGIGYWVYIGNQEIKDDQTIYIHQVIREDASDLYGFPDLDTLLLFETLLGVSGIGPKAAVSIINLGSANRISEAIEEGDVSFLSSAQGVGMKASQKIILELKGKLILSSKQKTNNHDDLVSALMGLGYKRSDINQAINEMPTELTDINQQIKYCLQYLTK